MTDEQKIETIIIRFFRVNEWKMRWCPICGERLKVEKDYSQLFTKPAPTRDGIIPYYKHTGNLLCERCGERWVLE